MFEGFLLEDFDAYLPEKWSSNMFTLPRRKVKDKLDFVGRKLSDEFDAQGLVLTKHLSDDHPSLWNKKKVDTQWLFFSRDVAAQKELSDIIDTERTLGATLADPTPLFRHIFLGASLNKEHLEVALRLHFDAWVDRKNALALLGEPAKRDEFIALCRGLNGDFEIGLSGGELVSTSELNADTLATLIAGLEDTKGWLFVGRRISKEQANELGEDVLNIISQSSAALIGVYRFLSWSPANDAVSLDRIVASKKEAREDSHAELERERQAREQRRKDQAEQRQKRREEVEQKVLDDQEWRQRERAIRRAAAISAAAREEEYRAQAKSEAKSSEKPTQRPGAETVSSEIGGRESTKRPSRSAESSKPSSPPADAKRQRRDSRSEPSRDRRPTSSDRGRRSEQNRPRRENRDKGSFKSKAAAKGAPKLAKVSEERKADVQIGDHIAVLSGFLKGRSGIVQSIDEKGDLKVFFGSLTSRVARRDVQGLGPAA